MLVIEIGGCMKKFYGLMVAIVLLTVACAKTESSSITGLRQSPIDIVTADIEEGTPASLVSDFGIITKVARETYDFKFYATGTSEFEGKEYKMLQMHFHSGSEHTINGERYALEGHLVHQNVADENDLLVIGVVYNVGEANPVFERVLSIYESENKEDISAENISFASLFPANKSYFAYPGSLTTPPYSENVSWYVMANPVTISAEQLERHNTWYSNNYREVQDLKGRKPVYHPHL